MLLHISPLPEHFVHRLVIEIWSDIPQDDAPTNALHQASDSAPEMLAEKLAAAYGRDYRVASSEREGEYFVWPT